MYKGANVTVMVSDVQRALVFYRDALGFRFVQGYGDEWQEVEAPGVRIGLHPGGKAPFKEAPRNLSIGLRVDDLDAAVKSLKGRGVKFVPGPQDQGSRIAYFTDPDGNPLYLIEIKWG
jgi:catechol 2,3-dioxygenase-like lactoylglutathione lyase family enzyme